MKREKNGSAMDRTALISSEWPGAGNYVLTGGNYKILKFRFSILFHFYFDARQNVNTVALIMHW